MRGGKVINLLQNKIFHIKRIYFKNDSFLERLWNTGQRASPHPNVRHLPAFSLKDGLTLKLNGGSDLINMNKILYFVVNKKVSNGHFSASRNIFEVQLLSTLLENFLKLGKQLLSLTKKAISQEDIEKQWGGSEAYKLITFIKDDFNEIISKHPVTLVFFSAEWCNHCLRLKTHFGTAALMAKEANLPVVFATFDVNSNPDIADENGIVGIPTIKYYKNGKIISTFRGKRNAEEIFNYVKNPPASPPEGQNIEF